MCLGGEEGIECSVYYKNQGRKRETPTRTIRGRDTDAIIVTRDEGKTYADLLKTVKKGTRTAPSEATGGIEQIRQTRDGNMLIAVKRDQRKAAQVKEALSKLAGGTIKARMSAAGRRGGGVSTLHVREMDAITTSKGCLADGRASRCGAGHRQ